MCVCVSVYCTYIRVCTFLCCVCLCVCELCMCNGCARTIARLVCPCDVFSVAEMKECPGDSCSSRVACRTPQIVMHHVQ